MTLNLDSKIFFENLIGLFSWRWATSRESKFSRSVMCDLFSYGETPTQSVNNTCAIAFCDRNRLNSIAIYGHKLQSFRFRNRHLFTGYFLRLLWYHKRNIVISIYLVMFHPFFLFYSLIHLTHPTLTHPVPQ